MSTDQIEAATAAPAAGRKSLKRWILPSIPMVVFVVLCLVFWVGLGYDPRELPSVMIDKPLPNFSLPALSSNKLGLDSKKLGNKPVLINFFASWCQPCRLEQPVLNRIALKDEVPLYGIAYKDREEDSKNYLIQLGDPYKRIGVDIEGRAGIDFGVTGVPETFLVDGKGVIRYRYSGPISEDVFRREILPRVKQLEAAQQ